MKKGYFFHSVGDLGWRACLLWHASHSVWASFSAPVLLRLVRSKQHCTHIRCLSTALRFFQIESNWKVRLFFSIGIWAHCSSKWARFLNFFLEFLQKFAGNFWSDCTVFCFLSAYTFLLLLKFNEILFRITFSCDQNDPSTSVLWHHSWWEANW